MSVTRSTISFEPENWSKIQGADNRSRLVNEALAYFFSAKDFLKEKEEEFILGELAHYKKTGEHYSFDETFND